MSGISSILPTGIKSIQRGVITFTGTAITATASITPVSDVAKCELTHLGTKGADAPSGQVQLVFTDASTITGNRTSPTSGSACSFQVTEYY